VCSPVSDPGWSGVWRDAARGLIPGFGARRTQRVPGIRAMRSVFVSFVVAGVLYGVILAFIDLGKSTGSPSSTQCIAIVCGIGIGSIGAVALFRNRPLDVSSADALASSYRRNLFLKVTFAQVPGLTAFALTFLSASHAVYPVGLAWSLLAFALGAPTRADVERRQSQIRVSGSPLDLLEALRKVAPRPQRQAWPRKR
jgi:hypothetical protein